jgi:putative sigma-54 modulation protein
MKLQIITKNVELSESMLAYANKKVSRLNRYLPNIGEGKLEISRENAKLPTQRFIAQITIDSKGTIIRAQERASDVRTAIDNVTDALAQRVRRFKGKLYYKGRGTSIARQEITTEAEEPQEVKKVVKTKHFLVKPMSTEEAIIQMELLGHDFFLFINSDSDKLGLLYRRKDGAYGLIEPETG